MCFNVSVASFIYLFIYLLFLMKLRPDNLSRIFFRNYPCNLATCLRSRALYPGEIWKRNFRSENTQMVSVHTNLDKFENATITGHFGFAFEGNSGREITWLSWRHRSRKAAFSKCFPSTLKRKVDVLNSSSLKSVFENLRSLDGLVWTVEIKLRFQIPPVWGAFSKSSVFVTD